MEKQKLLIKVGGSIMEKSDDFSELMSLFEEVSEQTRLILTTGSKELSDVIREYIGSILPNGIELENHVDITMQSRDMIARSLADYNDNFSAVEDINDIGSAHNAGKIPVLIQYPMLKELKPFQLRRGLSTDTTSAYFAHKMGVDKFIKLTDVDGVYEDMSAEASPMPQISTKQLDEMGRTCVDITLAKYLEELNLKCFVMNGLKIGNLRRFLYNQDAIHTCVYP